MHKFEPPFVSVEEILHKSAVPQKSTIPIERIIGRLLTKDSSNRAFIADLLCDEWFKDIEKDLDSLKIRKVHSTY
jgi:hypothetical protein